MSVFHRAEEIFTAALDQPEAERESFVRGRCLVDGGRAAETRIMAALEPPNIRRFDDLEDPRGGHELGLWHPARGEMKKNEPFGPPLTG